MLSRRAPSLSTHPAAFLLALALLLPGTAALRACLSASAPRLALLAPGEPGFAAAVARSLFPRPSPAWHVAAAGVDDVAPVVRCARAAGVKVCARSGGHSFYREGALRGRHARCCRDEGV